MKRLLALTYVIVQFGLIGLIAWHTEVWGGVAQNSLMVIGVALGVWAIATMHLRVSVLPDVRNDQVLYTSGPYRYIRHPMYTAVLLVTLSWVLNQPDYISWLLWLALVNDLLLKLMYEERQLLGAFPGYRHYMKHTTRLIPRVY